MTNHMITRFRIRCLNRALVALLWIGLLTSHAISQTTTSTTLRLNVVDLRGGAVPGATVVLNWEGSNEQISKVTTADGAVTFVNLRPGSTNVTVKANGFATLEQSVTVSENKSNEYTLSVGPWISDKIKSLKLPLAGRFARGFQYQYELNEQPGTVLVDFRLGSEVPPQTVTRPIRNPQNFLQKHTLTLKFGELISDRLSLFKRGNDYLKKHPEAADPNKQLSEILCGKKPLITCLTLGGSWWQRALMGTSISASLAQRPSVLQQILISSLTVDKKYQFIGGFVFDPAKLFPPASNWKSTLDDVQKIDNSFALIGASDVEKEPWKKRWAAVIPKVEFKMIAQFDFLKYNGVLIEAPFPERALNTWTFTWDLTRAIPDTKNRIDADAIEEALNDLQSNLGREKEKQPTWEKRCRVYLGQEVRDVKDLHPTFRAESCKRLAETMKAGKYQLSCVLKDEKGEDKDRQDGAERRVSDDPAMPNPNSCKWRSIKPVSRVENPS